MGIAILLRAGPLYRLLGNAAGLIGGGMLIGGATLKLLEKATPEAAALCLLIVRAGTMAGALVMVRKTPSARFLLGAVTLMGAVMHLVGLYTGMTLYPSGFGLPSAAHLYATLLLLALGFPLDLRFVSALAIAPFAQMLDTSTSYFHAAYVFSSPEPSLRIPQMGLAMIAALWLVQHRQERIGRHAGIFAIMAFMIKNLCFLVGSLWGDVPGQSYITAPLWEDFADDTARDAAFMVYYAAIEAWQTTAFDISADAFSIIWALALLAMAACAAHRGRRGLFNATLTFGAIHAYTQMFEGFGDEPLAFVIDGLAAVPLAWRMWRINERFGARHAALSHS